MFSQGPRHSLHQAGTILTAAITCFAVVGAHGAQPFSSATVTKVENRVNYGDRKTGANSVRPAAPKDVIRASNYLLSESNSRAEIEYPDGSLVRIGQNTVFSFDSDSRTLSLDKGTLIFHIPKGSGGGAIKTPSLTAAITGTTVKVSVNILAVVEGTLKLEPSGRLVHAGEFARRNPDGSITIAAFDPAKTNEGSLVYFNGLMPGFEEKNLTVESKLFPPDLRALEVLHRANNLPSTVGPLDRPPTRVRAPRDNDNNNNGNGSPSIY